MLELLSWYFFYLLLFKYKKIVEVSLLVSCIRNECRCFILLESVDSSLAIKEKLVEGDLVSSKVQNWETYSLGFGGFLSVENQWVIFVIKCSIEFLSINQLTHNLLHHSNIKLELSCRLGKIQAFKLALIAKHITPKRVFFDLLKDVLLRLSLEFLLLPDVHLFDVVVGVGPFTAKEFVAWGENDVKSAFRNTKVLLSWVHIKILPKLLRNKTFFLRQSVLSQSKNRQEHCWNVINLLYRLWINMLVQGN